MTEPLKKVDLFERFGMESYLLFGVILRNIEIQKLFFRQKIFRCNDRKNRERRGEYGEAIQAESQWDLCSDKILAGLTTFMTMAYIIALNPNLLTNFDVGSSLWNGVFMATCIASAIGMFAMAFLANKPFALAPGMGLNSFFALVVANIAGLTGMTYVESFQSALVIILLEGIIFVALSVLNIREKIVGASPGACGWASALPSASC